MSRLARARYRVTAVGPPREFTAAARAPGPPPAVDALEVHARPVTGPGHQWGEGWTFAARAPAGGIGFYIPPAGAAWARVGAEFYLDVVPAAPDAA